MTSSLHLDQRSSGLLLHLTSLPGPHGSGDLGPHAYQFVDFLAAAGQRWWQMLPLGPSNSACPYNAYSAFAGNPLLISLDRLAEEGLLDKSDVRPGLGGPADRMRFEPVRQYRTARLRKASQRFFSQRRGRAAYEKFCHDHSPWLDDFALFTALREKHDHPSWLGWDERLRTRDPDALASARQALHESIRLVNFQQFQFHRQWAQLQRYCRTKKVGLIGDIPIYIAHDSCDVWAHRRLFRLDASGRPKVVSGAPPDGFNTDGQRWGHPLYDWAHHRQTHFTWWAQRFRHALDLFDAVRVDHFLGFIRYWEIPARLPTAKHGRWRRAPGEDLFRLINKQFMHPRIFVEDLGAMTPQVAAVRDRLQLPGMRVLQFAFGDDDNEHQPHNFPRNCVVYTATHDSPPTASWFRHTSTRGPRGLSERRRVLLYARGDPKQIHWSMIQLAMQSVANLCIIPVQDVLGLGARARMNVPGTTRNNWLWRMHVNSLNGRLARRLHRLTAMYGRLRIAAAKPSPHDLSLHGDKYS